MHSLVDSYVPWPGIEPATLAYQDNTLTNWATQLELFLNFSNVCFLYQYITSMIRGLSCSLLSLEDPVLKTAEAEYIYEKKWMENYNSK